MAHEAGSVRARLDGSVKDAWQVYCQLEEVLPHPEVRHHEPISRSKLSASSPAWHSQAADLVLELHYETRRIEASLRDPSTDMARGTSQSNTRYSLHAIALLMDGQPEESAWATLNYIENWIRRGNAVFVPDDMLRRLPRSPGEGEARCPWCSFQTLRWRQSSGVVSCVNPACVNDNGQRPRWKAEFRMTETEMVFAWRDLGEQRDH